MDKKKAKATLIDRLAASEPESFRSWQRFTHLWPEIREALEAGYTIRDIHAALVDGGEWVSGYDVFRRHITRAKRMPDARVQ